MYGGPRKRENHQSAQIHLKKKHEISKCLDFFLPNICVHLTLWVSKESKQDEQPKINTVK